jgi:uncharacterized membrane protein YoaK (UPF0700 family)
MSDVRPARETTVPLTLPVLLSFVAGYVDSYTFLTLFGLFVAQVTSSFVMAGAEIVIHDYSVTAKLLVVVVFVVAGSLTAALIAWARQAGHAALPSMLVLEAALLAIFAAMLLYGPKVTDARDWNGIVAGLVAAAAMGAQSVLVRLLMKGVPQTNVMTGNMTQLAVAATELVFAWRQLRDSRHTPGDLAEFTEARSRLLTVLFIALGFLVGAALGAIAFAVTGLRGVAFAPVIVGALALWALYIERRA